MTTTRRLASALSALAALAAAAAPPPIGPTEAIVFQDDFNSLDLTIWKHELTLSGEGNWEFEWYGNNRTVSYAKNGTLFISPKLTASVIGAAGLNNADVNLWGGDPATACTDNGFYGCERTGGGGGNIINPIISARLRTAESFAFKYGRVEFVARLPRGDWMWPALWLMPTNAAYGQWPASGEIDIVESRGNARGYPGGGCESFSSTLHYGPYWPQDAYLNAHASYSAPSGDLSTDFHTYGLLWTKTGITTYIDDTVVLDLPVNESFWERGNFDATVPGSANPWSDSENDVAPFDQRMYIIMNVAVGGTNGYFPDGAASKPWQDTSNSAANEFWSASSQWLPSWTSPMMVDSVKVWQAPEQGGDYVLRPML